MDHLSEYVFFKKEKGIRRLTILAYSSYIFFAGYLLVAVANIKTFVNSVSW